MSVNPPEPQTPFERKVYIIFFLGVLAVLTVGLCATWAVMVATGNGTSYPSALQNLTYLLVAFWIGVQVKNPIA